MRLYKTPYGPDAFLLDAESRLAGFVKVIKKTVELKPYGWDERDPFVRITYHIFNGSQFPVLFGDPRGTLFVRGSALHDEPKLNSGEGWWNSQATAQLKIDQRMKLDFWNELAQNEKPGSVIESLTGTFNVSLSSQSPGLYGTRISLDSETPFLTEWPR